jgi:hypothetical protein
MQGNRIAAVLASSARDRRGASYSPLPCIYEKLHESVGFVTKLLQKPNAKLNQHIRGETFWIYAIRPSQIQPASAVMAHA